MLKSHFKLIRGQKMKRSSQKLPILLKWLIAGIVTVEIAGFPATRFPFRIPYLPGPAPPNNHL
jgi:hypothetical protein